MRVWALTSMLIGLTSLTPAVARAADVDPTPVSADVRLFAGFGTGLGAEVWSPGGRLRADLEAGSLIGAPFDWGAIAAIVPLVGQPREFLGVRAGYQLDYIGQLGPDWHGSRSGHALDAGVVGRIESSGGKVLEGGVGFEGLFRGTPAGCCDNAFLPTASAGLRFALLSELALTDSAALFIRGVLRTAQHLPEIGVLPIADAGLRYRF